MSFTCALCITSVTTVFILAQKSTPILREKEEATKTLAFPLPEKKTVYFSFEAAGVAE